MKRRISNEINPLRMKFPSDDYYGVFRNLESASKKNLDAFCELLEYTYDNRREVEKKDDLKK